MQELLINFEKRLQFVGNRINFKIHNTLGKLKHSNSSKLMFKM